MLGFKTQSYIKDPPHQENTMLTRSAQYIGAYGTLLLSLVEEMTSERLSDIPGPSGLRAQLALKWNVHWLSLQCAAELHSEHLLFMWTHMYAVIMLLQWATDSAFYTLLCVQYCPALSVPSTTKHPLFLEISAQTFFKKKISLMSLPRSSFLIKHLNSTLFVLVVHNIKNVLKFILL